MKTGEVRKKAIMTKLPVATEIIPMVLQLQPAIAMSDDQFYEFCQINRDFRIGCKWSTDCDIIALISSTTNRWSRKDKSYLLKTRGDLRRLNYIVI